MIRITGGKFRSRLLDTPQVETTKPTMDKVRQAVFSALSFDIENRKVLDLFSGSGSYGFEALSRGASSVTFVEQNKVAVSSIMKNISTLNVSALVKQENVISYLKNTDETFDIVFMDPPYKLDIYEEVLNIIKENNILNDNGIIVLESEKELDLDFSYFNKYKFYKYGLAKIYILRK